MKVAQRRHRGRRRGRRRRRRHARAQLGAELLELARAVDGDHGACLGASFTERVVHRAVVPLLSFTSERQHWRDQRASPEILGWLIDRQAPLPLCVGRRCYELIRFKVAALRRVLRAVPTISSSERSESVRPLRRPPGRRLIRLGTGARSHKVKKHK